jgi:malonyl-CoA O-methyltransferase
MSDGKTQDAIISAFDAAAATYDAASQVQREIARELVFRAALDFKGNPKTILDLGSGAGHVTDFALKQWPGAELTALDAAPKMLAALQGKFPAVTIIQADAAAPGAIGRYDLILSSMMAHWLPEPRQALARWLDLLSPGGRMLVALPVSGSFWEWRDACRAEGLTDGLSAFPQPGFATGLCESSKTIAVAAEYDDARTFLQAFRRTGARKSRPGHKPLSPANLRHLLSRQAKPFAATFKIEFLVFSRPSPAAPRGK